MACMRHSNESIIQELTGVNLKIVGKHIQVAG
jgi:hypothetical protein